MGTLGRVEKELNAIVVALGRCKVEGSSSVIVGDVKVDVAKPGSSYKFEDQNIRTRKNLKISSNVEPNASLSQMRLEGTLGNQITFWSPGYAKKLLVKR